MKITIDSLTRECDKLADILPYVDLKATIEVDEGGHPYIGIHNVSSAWYHRDVESGRFYTAKDVLLENEICFYVDNKVLDFSSYAEAETYFRKNGLRQEAEMLRKVIKILDEPDYILCPYNDALYLFRDDELDASGRRTAADLEKVTG